MKMADREYVEGTEPRVYIGHRTRKLANGEVYVSKVWHAEYSLNRRQNSKSLETTVRSVAIRMAHSLCQKLAEGNQSELKPMKKVTLTELKDAYLDMLTNRGRAPKTLLKYRFNLTEFANWWIRKGDYKVVKFTVQDFWSYRKWLKEIGKSDQTIADRLVLVKQLFKWGAGKGKMIPINPLAEESVAEPPPTAQPCFTPEQVEMLLAKAKPHERAAFLAMAYSGLRIGEVAALRWEDVLLDRGPNGSLHIRLGGSNGTTKGKTSRTIPIHPELRKLLLTLPRCSTTVFVQPKTKRYPFFRPLRDRVLLKSLKRLCEKCGFPGAEKFKLHTFRHAFASMCARSQVSYKYALTWMGHKSSDILDMYFTMYDDAAAEAIKSIEYQKPPTTSTPSNERTAPNSLAAK